ncbi:MAG: EscU/YscU/HrcU family type III secretion system export apparatus switch protein [Planctomycetaceae bacterium]|jgi:flagellar biosynthetic protein FlhB|nr:EscU/YscU/HrcU family type III secretion system export apparatus switch protein [Planctomycetaceae bacterium]
MPSEGGEKSHDPTPKRLEQAREEGQVAKSQDLASAFVLLFAVILLMTLGKQLSLDIYEYAQELYGNPLFLIPENEGDGLYQSAQALLHETIIRFMKPLSLFFVLLAVTGIAANVMQTGLLFLPKKLAPDITNLSIFKGIKRIFSLQSVMRLVMGIVKIIICAGVAWFAVEGNIGQILNLTANDNEQIISFLVWTLLLIALKVAVALVLIALVDLMYQRWKFMQDMKMTNEEVREEMKNMMGDPQIISKRRQIQREMATKQRAAGTADADVVVTNPTHLSVAVKYDARTMDGPVIVAKGADFIAFQIRKIAAENGIPIVERKPLARALFNTVDIGQPITLIPEQMKTLVEVLQYAYRLAGRDFESEIQYHQRKKQRKTA